MLDHCVGLTRLVSVLHTLDGSIWCELHCLLGPSLPGSSAPCQVEVEQTLVVTHKMTPGPFFSSIGCKLLGTRVNPSNPAACLLALQACAVG